MKYLHIALLILLAGLQYRLWASHGSMPDVWRLEQIRDAQSKENRGLEERNQSLAAEVIDLKEGMEAVEERARSEMGMIEQGETFYQIVQAPRAPADGQSAP